MLPINKFSLIYVPGINTTAWTSSSSLLSLGLSVPQAMGVVVGASLISSIIAVITGWMGSHHYLGFTVLSRGFVDPKFLLL